MHARGVIQLPAKYYVRRRLTSTISTICSGRAGAGHSILVLPVWIGPLPVSIRLGAVPQSYPDKI